MTESPGTRPRSFSLAPNHRALLLLTLVSLAAFALAKLFSTERVLGGAGAGGTAAATMERAISVVREEFVSCGGRFDDAIDPNHTSLIGEEYTGLTSTLGSLEAKRTTTNPNTAALLVQLLREAGVSAGDTIAVGCSGSFPALAVATLSAAKAMGVYPVVILSIGASSFGATRVDQTLLDIYELVRRRTDLNFPAAAVSLGGANDSGSDFEPEIRNKLIEKIQMSGIPFLNEPDLSKNVDERMRIYFGPSSKRRIAAFVNIGGSYADMGTNPLILNLEPGVNTHMTVPSDERTHGVVFAMSKHHIPVVHLLHIKGLALAYGLPWDPIPLPPVSGGGIFLVHSVASRSEWILAVAYFISVTLIVAYYRKAFFRKYS
ncbi:MAG: poly-gamma-glutamate system protein [Ignavibacteriales bacterium]|nr:poly-gamma-glutamate system protein [Ignavibacteriales bacterium]